MTSKIYTISEEEISLSILNLYNAIDGKDETAFGGVTKRRVEENLDLYGKAMDFFMSYPDVFLDVCKPTNSSFELFPFQRVSLRAKMRKRQVYETATRGASKSWVAFASRYLTCMFVPGHTSFVSTDVKSQAVAIAREKIQDDLWIKYPLLSNEMRSFKLPGSSATYAAFHHTTNTASYRFTSRSRFDVVGVDSARGRRRHSGLIEEVIEQDQKKVNETLIPLMNIERRTALGKLNPKEPFNSQKIFVTSAGYKNTFAYDKMIETLLMMVINPEEYMLITIDYRVPMRHGLLSEKLIREIKSSPSFDIDSFEREYGSIWSGEMKGAVISTNAVEKTRVVKRADYKAREFEDLPHGDPFYVVGADMAKDGSANTAISVIRVTPGPTFFRYTLVNGFISKSSDYEVVSNELKETALKYKARLLVVDTNGIGAAIRDWLNKPSVDKSTGVPYPGFGILNPPKTSEKDVIKYRENNIVYEIKANGGSASNINWFFFSRIKSGSFKMLVNNREAIDAFSKSQRWMAMPLEKQQLSLRPYQFCDKLEQELLNLDVAESNEGTLKVKRRNLSIEKDLFSSVSYAMYGTHLEIEMPTYQRKLKPKTSLKDFIMIS